MASVIVRKSDDRVMDASDKDNLNYDSTLYDNLHPTTNPIPAGENPQKYIRNGAGVIVKRSLTDLITHFEDERKTNVKAKWTKLKASIPDAVPWKADFIALGQALGWDV